MTPDQATTEWVNKYLEECHAVDSDLTPEDRHELKSTMSTRLLKKVFGLLLQEINGKLNLISMIPLTTEDAVKGVILQQGEVAGMRRVLTLFLEETVDPTPTQETETDNADDHNQFVNPTDDVLAVLNHDPFTGDTDVTVDDVTPKSDDAQPSSEEPAATPEPAPATPAETAPATAPDPEPKKATDAVVPAEGEPKLAAPDANLEMLNNLAAQVAQQPTAPKPAATPNAAEDPKPAAAPTSDLPEYNFNITPELMTLIGSEDQNEARNGMGLLIQGVAQGIHKTVMEAAMSQMTSVVETMMTSQQSQRDFTAEQKRMTDDYFSTFPAHKPYAALVQQVSKQLIVETGATVYDDNLRNAVGAKINSMIGAQPVVPADPAKSTPPKTVAGGGARSATTPVGTISDEIMQLK